MERLKMKSIIQITLIGLIVLGSSISSFSQDIHIVSEPEKLFKKGDSGIAEFRIPSMITTNKGTILTVCDGRVDRPGDVPNNIDLVMRRLEKGSKKWTPIERIVDFAGDQGAADPSLIQDRT
ncbi:MAG: exo-alpha-sialidase, partial [Cyclobacteriaceae bacterium]|nr:exo-alpha-sialidase [Cyclobacteriaceae bacterium]